MRDPRAPIPHPNFSRGFWRNALPPRPATEAAEISYDFDPRRLVHEAAEDHLGIDRRTAPREIEAIDELEEDPGEDTAVDARRCVLAGAHRRFDALLGLSTEAGWALVRTLTLSPNGVLLRVVDPCDPKLDPALRTRTRSALARLSPAIADGAAESMLATVGTCLLSGRVVADLSRWAHSHQRGCETSRVLTRTHLEVELVVPPPTPPQGRMHMRIDPVLGPPPPPRAVGTRFQGTLAPLNDPNDLVVGVAMHPEDRLALERLLSGPRRARSAVPHLDDEGLAPASLAVRG